MKQRPVVTVFGSAMTRPGDADYALAETLGRKLAEAGYTVCNGGYMGSMEASAKGAREAGGDALGITTADFSNRTPNPYLTEERQQPKLLRRIETLIDTADAYVILSGGIGTLAELFVVWNLLFMKCIPPRPVLLLGENYPRMLQCFQELAEIGPEHLQYLTPVSTIEETLERLRSHLSQ